MKYVGSKASIVKHITPFIHERLKPGCLYVEPFVGGGNSIVKVNHCNKFGSDSNKYVVALLIALRDGWEPIYIDNDEYIDIRTNKDNYEDNIVGWAGIGCSYSGKWFGGYAGVTETKTGTRDYIDESIRNCLRQAKLLKGIELSSEHYNNLDIQSGSVVYCDPPYANTMQYKDNFDSNQFWDWANSLSNRCEVLVSEYYAPKGWVKLWSKNKTSSLSANGEYGGNKTSVESLFINEYNI